MRSCRRTSLSRFDEVAVFQQPVVEVRGPGEANGGTLILDIHWDRSPRRIPLRTPKSLKIKEEEW